MFVRAYAELLAERNEVDATDADLAALRGITKDRSASFLERFHALTTLATALWAVGNWEHAGKANAKALRLEARATPEQRAEKILVLVDGGGERSRWITVAEDISEGLRIAKDKAEGAPLPSDASLRHTNPSAMVVRDARYTVFRLVWPLGTIGDAEPQAALRRALRDRSAECSQCGATRVPLSCCGKCRLARYCSPACQRANWAVHRLQCRAPGDHRPGDVVQLQNLLVLEGTNLNGQFVVVVRRDEQRRAGCWLVENQGWAQTGGVIVQPVSMRRVLSH